MDRDVTRPGYLYYIDGVPGWRIRVPQPSRFQGVDISVQLRLFKLPPGCLFAMIFRLYDVPDQPYYVHRVLDVSDLEVEGYLTETLKHLVWIVEIEGTGEDKGCVRAISFRDTRFTRLIREARVFNGELGPAHDGSAALTAFLDVFEPAAKEAGWEAGWAAVDEKFGLKG